MTFPLYKWLRIALINLVIVAIFGITMRYKILYSLPLVNQKHLLHAHSHFAFYGWISQVMLTLFVSYIHRRTNYETVKKYTPVLIANLICAYGMLISFSIQGYGLFSISFSILSIFVIYYFTIIYWRDLKKIKPVLTHKYLKLALIFNIISSVGAFALAWLMATNTANQRAYLASIYYFLHFQYNGWFFFAAMGLFSNKLYEEGVDEYKLKRVFWAFALSCIPAYFLSVLWLPMPTWVYIIVVISAVLQVYGWGVMLVIIKSQLSLLRSKLSPLARWMLTFAGFALTIKLLLQLGSVIPSLSTLSYSFRPIIIGYLHLVLLGVFTLFILGYMFAYRIVIPKKKAWWGVIIFTIGVILNELILLLQGVTYMGYFPLPYMNESLLGASLIMLTGLLFIVIMMREPLESEKIPWQPKIKR
ncbi:MAG: hypothetical protein KF829_01835 [Ferruginibacter sp.]|nr:hypothetical protein [Ferruginibacter sp.]